MKTEVVLKSEKRLDNHIWNLFNENRSCIEIGGRTEVFTVRCSLMKTEVVLKLL